MFNIVVAAVFSEFFLFIREFLIGLNKSIQISSDNRNLVEFHLQIFYEICKILKILSKHFKIILLTSMTAQFFVTLNMLYSIFIVLIGDIKIDNFFLFCSFAWVFFNFYLIQRNLRRIKNIENEFTKLFISTKSYLTFQIIYVQENMKFTAGELFDIDYSVMTMFFSSIVSYLIVIIQFHLQM